MRRVLSRARVWIAVPLLAGGLFAFQSQAVANGHHPHQAHKHSHVEKHSDTEDHSETEDHSKVEGHSRTCNTNEEAHESPQAQKHENEHGCP